MIKDQREEIQRCMADTERALMISANQITFDDQQKQEAPDPFKLSVPPYHSLHRIPSAPTPLPSSFFSFFIIGSLARLYRAERTPALLDSNYFTILPLRSLA